MKKRTWAIWALAASLVVGANIGTAWSYFSTYATAQGGYTLNLGDYDRIHEEVDSGRKKIVVESDENSEPVYIRLRYFSGSTHEVKPEDQSGGKWVDGGDGYWYYTDIVNGGESTGELDLVIDDLTNEDSSKEDFNVVVVYESAPVRYNADGTPYGATDEATWEKTLDVVTEGGGN